jgi:DNA-binding NarL/FixJ family response regulator
MLRNSHRTWVTLEAVQPSSNDSLASASHWWVRGRRGALNAGLLSGLTVTAVWAGAGAHHFWPGWVWFGLAIPAGFDTSIRWGLRARNRRPLAVQGAVSVLLSAVSVVAWLLSGFGYFWPVWSILGLAVAFSAHILLLPLLSDTRERALVERVDVLTRTRQGALDVQAAELQRVERDLHDGAQARLVSLGMSLGMADELLDSDPTEARRLLREARSTARAALTDLRDLVRGILPPVLADRGLGEAVQALALTVPIPITVTVDLPEHRLAPPPGVGGLLRSRRGRHQRRQAQRRRKRVDPGPAPQCGAGGGGRRPRARRRRSLPGERAEGYRAATRLLRRDGARVEPPGRAYRRRHGGPVRAVIAEDLALLRDGLVRMLTAHDVEVVEAVADGGSVLGALIGHHPDVAVLDVRLPPTFTNEGLMAAIEARRQIPGLPVLVLSQYVEPLYARELLSDGAGGVGYLLKDRVMDVGQFIDTVRRVAAGGTVMDPEVVAQLLVSRARDEPLARLTPREREVLSLVAQGRSNAAVASGLIVTEKAISKHTANIFMKLDLPPSDDDNRRVLAVLAYLNS